MMIKKILTLLLFTLVSLTSFADEGMWLPSLISDRLADMQEKGLKLSAEDIYSINQASLKDAVVLFGRGCTGELISAKGLLLTNHHCGYGQIQKHSSVEHDYLKDGFWAMTMDEELPNKGLTVSFLERMDDVTKKVLKGYSEGMSENERDSIVKINSKILIADAIVGGKGLRAQVEALYYGNQYFLFIFRTFSDIRLVGAPASSIGKFGGDTDNWMWPRHTGDFSLFRIYADKDNNPAEYSKDNQPYSPKKFFKIATRGVKEGDFTFVYGFPGSTQEYITSDAVKYIEERSNPHKITLRTLRLDAQKEYMNKDQAVRIKYSSKNASVSNAWKKWQGETKGLIKMNTVEVKKEYETRFREWAEGGEYEGVLDSLAVLYKKLDEYAFAADYYRESVNTVELVRFATSIQKELQKDSSANTIPVVEAFFKDYYMPIDRKSFISVMNQYNQNVPEKFKPDYFRESMEKFGSIESWAENLFTKSIFINKHVSSGLNAQSDISSDPAILFGQAFQGFYTANILPVTKEINREIKLLYRSYMRGQMEFDSDKIFYPDANLTLRIAYGNIAGYHPSDAVYYTPSSTLEGVMQKDNPEIFDYDVPAKLREIYKNKDYGRWAENGTVPVCFIATNHTTGGNSGSPVINAEGYLIGINFDRVWEGTMSDIVFDPDVCRNITLDVRYILFVIDKVAGCGRLIEEMEFSN